MIAALVVLLLNHSTGVQLGDSAPYRHASLDDGARLDAMTRHQITVELRWLEHTRPSAAGPGVMLAMGGGVAVVGLSGAMLGSTMRKLGTAPRKTVIDRG